MTPEIEKAIRIWAEKDCGSKHPVNELLAEIDRLRAEVKDWKGTHAHLQTESSILIANLEQEIDRLRAEKQTLWIDKANLESADSRYEFLYEVTQEQINELTKERDQLRDKLTTRKAGKIKPCV